VEKKKETREKIKEKKKWIETKDEGEGAREVLLYMLGPKEKIV